MRLLPLGPWLYEPGKSCGPSGLALYPTEWHGMARTAKIWAEKLELESLSE